MTFETILLDKQENVKLCDFGLARVANTYDPISKIYISAELRRGWFIGTEGYAPPELILGDGGHAGAADMWSAGCILLALMNRGGLPRQLREVQRESYEILVQEFVMQERRNSRYVSESSVLKPAKRFLYDCLLYTNPNDRASAELALSHPYMNDEVEVNKDGENEGTSKLCGFWNGLLR